MVNKRSIRGLRTFVCACNAGVSDVFSHANVNARYANEPCFAVCVCNHLCVFVHIGPQNCTGVMTLK